MKKLFLTIIAFLLFICGSYSQEADSLLQSLDSSKFSGGKTFSTFKSTRVVLSHSSETQKKFDLDLRIRHHFGDIGGDFGSSHTLYGLDIATDLYIGLDYGLTNRLTVGVGRSKHDELFNFFIKHKAIEQSKKTVPVTISLLAQAGVIAREENFDKEFNSDSTRNSYLLQAIIARKFSEHLSLQVSPSYLLRSEHVAFGDQKNLFSLGFAGRFKLSRRLSLIGDYQLVNAFRRPDSFSDTYYNPLGIGLEIETGGHIFSLNFMNSEYIIENNFLPDTKKSWSDGGVRFGFTISRNFSLSKSKNPDVQSKIY
ncbi:DUF5777 family beta-barrel protein [Pedobacter sp. P351]|uniref:DUF5777 family beta-barrel protein n=1 Tax=Pedobacter superstes TaxID=3133441 RepID=UPI0030B64A7B